MRANGGSSGTDVRRRYVPALLDALFPGLGHLVAGRRRRAAIFGIPVIVAILIGALIVATSSLPRLAATLFDPAVLWGLLGLQLLFLVWRLLAVAASVWEPSLPRPGRLEFIPIAAIMLLAVIAPQAYAGYATEVARETADGDLRPAVTDGSRRPAAERRTRSELPDPGIDIAERDR